MIPEFGRWKQPQNRPNMLEEKDNLSVYIILPKIAFGSMFYLFGSLKNIRVASCTGRLLQQKICIKELCKNSFENIFNQTMRNSRNLQKRIVAASIKTLQIKLLSSRLMFDNSTKLTKFFIFREKQKICLDKKRSMWKVTFYFSKNMSSITFFKKKVPWEKFVKKRRIFCKIFRNMWNVLELQCLVDDLHEVDMGLRNVKKTLFIFLKTVTDELHYWLITTHVENKFCIEKGRVIVTKDDRLSH